MNSKEEIEETSNFNPEKVEKCLGQMVDLLGVEKLTVGELIILISNLQYSIGASIDGYEEKGPSLDKLRDMYYQDPTLGTALMLNAATISTWYDDWQEAIKKKEDKE